MRDFLKAILFSEKLSRLLGQITIDLLRGAEERFPRTTEGCQNTVPHPWYTIMLAIGPSVKRLNTEYPKAAL